MIPHVDRFAAMLRKLEQGIHRHGWDVPATMTIIYGPPDAPPEAAVDLQAGRPFFLPRQAPPGDVLVAIAFNAATNTVKLPLPTPERLAGVAVCVETWFSTVAPEERHGRALADIPGSQEARMVYAVDTAERHHWVWRKRGYKPTYGNSVGGGEADENGGRIATMLGRVPDALSLIMLGTCRTYLHPPAYRVDQLGERIDELVERLSAGLGVT